MLGQNTDSTRVINTIGASAAITNNGISTIPTFSLGKPAAILDLSIGKKLTFEPQFRFSLEGKPWAYIFWLRYKVLKTDKFVFNIGAHPANIFKIISQTENGITNEIISTQRYLAAEFSPNYIINKNWSVGAYYLVSKGFKESDSKSTHFITLNSTVSNIKILGNTTLRINPQVYYLKIDANDGTYFSSNVSISNKKYPVSLHYMFNKTINTNISASKDFVWNLSLVYAFNRNQ